MLSVLARRAVRASVQVPAAALRAPCAVLMSRPLSTGRGGSGPIGGGGGGGGGLTMAQAPMREEEREQMLSTLQALEGDVGLQEYLKRITTRTATGLGTVALSAAGASAVLLPMAGPWPLLGLGLVGSIGAQIMMARTPVHVGYMEKLVQREKSDVHKIGEPEEKVMVPYIDHPANRMAYFHAFNVAQGLALAPMLAFYPAAIVPAAMGTVAITGGMLGAGLMVKDSSMVPMGGALFGGLCGLLGLGIANIFFQSPLLHSINVWGGIGLFSLYTAYDLHVAISEYREGMLDDLTKAVNFELNMINIFIRLLQVFRDRD